MIDPISAAATASAAFNAIQKGFQVARSIEDMASDLSRWMGALSDLEQAEKEAKNPPIFKKLFAGQSVEAEAMEAFAAKTRAEEQRAQLKQYIQFSYGQSKWDALVKMEGSIRKQRQETIYRQRERRRKFIEVVSIVLALVTGVGLLILLVMWLKGLQ
jgi:CHASE3 domain sensor protein